MSVGALFELGGIGTIVGQIRRDRRAFEEYRNRSRTLHVSAIASGHSMGKAEISGGRKLSIEERLDALEANLEGMRSQIRDQLKEQAESLTSALKTMVESVERNLQETVTALENLTLGLSGGFNQRRFGVWLFVIGLILNTVGNVWSVLVGT